MIEANLGDRDGSSGRCSRRTSSRPRSSSCSRSAELRSASPGAVVQLLAMNEEIDVRAILPTITVPTLVVHDTR